MAQTSRFWENISYSDDNFAEVLNRLFTDAVIGGIGNELVVAAGTGLQVTINTGEAWVNGIWYQNTASVTLTCGAGDPSNPRIDRIVIRKSASANTCELAIVAGTPAGSPTAPSLTQTTATWEISLAQVAIAAGASAVGAITSERAIRTNLIPKNLIAFTTDATAPTGWSTYTSAQGRYLVGVPSGGTIAYQVGTAMSNGQNKTHSHTIANHTHNQNMGTAYTTLLNDSLYSPVYAASNNNSDVFPAKGGGSTSGSIVRTGVASATLTPSDASTGDFAPYCQMHLIQKS